MPLERDGSWVVYGVGRRDVVLPDELVLRGLLDLQIDDLDEVVGFVAHHGALARLDGRLPFKVGRDWPAPEGDAVPLLELRVYLDLARALVNHWLAAQEDRDVRSAWEGVLLPSGHRRDTARVWSHWVDLINVGLQPFHVRAELPVEQAPHVVVGAPRVDLYSAMCLQLWNLAVEALPPQRCASETCRRPFVRQQGRARFDQHRTEGVKYCSRECARAQANREYRRRKRAGQARSEG